MCGIFFSIGFYNLSQQVIDSVAHRGPDGQGWNEFDSSYGPIVIAHRRLAIVDLSIGGHQPMCAAEQRYWITFNGEIYNYLEIKQELERQGYYFRTKTDTEVILRSFIHWGENCLNKFNGMFAFVIWDNVDKKIFIARDRFGVKPLYYYQKDSQIAFASEIKQFKHLPGWKFKLNESMAQFYKKHLYCDHSHETLYQNVYQILPGHCLNIDCKLPQVKPSKWYCLSDHIKGIKLSKTEMHEKFKEIFSDSIKLRLHSDVPVGACLSGGIDSSSIVSMMRLIEPSKQIQIFSSVFPGLAVDESRYIDELIAHKKLVAHKNIPSYDVFLKYLDQILYHQDLPFSGTSIFAQWMTFQSVKKNNVTVVLDGQGADESLLGYPGMLNGLFFDYLKAGNFYQLYQFLKWQKKINAQSFKTVFLLALQQRYFFLYKKILRLQTENSDKTQFSFKSITDVCLSHFQNNLQSLLRYEDRNSMAFSIESRLPFLDYRLVEFVLSLPVDERFQNTTTKSILRKTMKNINIDSILNRKDKIGFATPEKDWLNQISLSHNNFSDLIFDRWLKNESIL